MQRARRYIGIMSKTKTPRPNPFTATRAEMHAYWTARFESATASGSFILAGVYLENAAKYV